jgi:uncharacterized protein (TIGR00255 family)
MTGYGRSEVRTESLHFTVEARSVNHRYLDVAIRYPRLYAPLEARMKQLVGQHFTRGRIDITLTQQTNGGGQRALALDYALAREYYQALQQLQQTLDLPGTIDLGLLLGLREILKVEEAEADTEEAWDVIAEGLRNALHALKAMRVQEGAFLAADLRQRMQRVAEHVEGIRRRVPAVVTEYRERLVQRTEELFQQYTLDPERLHQEVVLLAERTDVTEELTRLDAHLQAFEQVLAASDSIGRKGEFLVQEMHREVNTIASKSNDAPIAHLVVDIKSELEKIREQIQNVE